MNKFINQSPNLFSPTHIVTDSPEKSFNSFCFDLDEYIISRMNSLQFLSILDYTTALVKEIKYNIISLFYSKSHSFSSSSSSLSHFGSRPRVFVFDSAVSCGVGCVSFFTPSSCSFSCSNLSNSSFFFTCTLK